MRTCQLTKEEFQTLAAEASNDLDKIVKRFMGAGVKIELKHVQNSDIGEHYRAVCTRVDPQNPSKWDTYEMIYSVPIFKDDLKECE